MEKPMTENPMSIRSSQPPWRHAAITPSGTAMRMVSASVSADSDRVGSMRWPISWSPSASCKYDSPRLPCSICALQLKNCTGSGWLSPSCSRTSAMFALVPLSPTMAAAGSPGVEPQHQEHDETDNDGLARRQHAPKKKEKHFVLLPGRLTNNGGVSKAATARRLAVVLKSSGYSRTR
jgi:hypothetical protein